VSASGSGAGAGRRHRRLILPRFDLSSTCFELVRSEDGFLQADSDEQLLELSFFFGGEVAGVQDDLLHCAA